jgi:hypothetical protein
MKSLLKRFLIFTNYMNPSWAAALILKAPDGSIAAENNYFDEKPTLALVPVFLTIWPGCDHPQLVL